MSGRHYLDDILEGAAAAGYPLSRDQLKRLRQNGLLQSPQQEHQVGVAGSESVYSDDQLQQLLGVLALKHEHGLGTFRKLRVGAWLGGFEVDFELLRPDVVKTLRLAITGQQRLPSRSEDDALSRRLRQALADINKQELAGLDQLLLSQTDSADAGITFEVVALALLQLVVGTTHADASRDRLDLGLQIINDETRAVSDIYEDWELPPTPEWPRIISRTGAKWFAPGQHWLDLVIAVIVFGGIDERVGTPLTRWAVDELKELLPDPSNLELRTMIACLGIVLSKQHPDTLIEMFEDVEEE